MTPVEMQEYRESTRGAFRKLLNQIDEQAATIDRLKAALVEERSLWQDGPCRFRTRYEWCDSKETLCLQYHREWIENCPLKDEWIKTAKGSLASELPDLFKEAGE